MTEQQEKQTSIEYLVKKINQLEQDLIEVEKHREESIKLAFDKGYKIGLKDGFISEEKKFHLKTKIMNDKSLERILDDISRDINEVFILLRQKIEELEQDLIEVEKLYEQVKLDRDEAFEKGYNQGQKYTDGIISDERFPF
jgi:DNA repair exonuclease SbcCD ATPase subunit